MRPYLSGLVTALLLTAGLCFFRFWKQTHDRFFYIFTAAFGMLALEKAVLAFTPLEYENRPYVFLIRLCAFGLLGYAIIDKNRSTPTSR